MSKLIPIIGLEIHVELNTNSKMFCSCANNPFIETPNLNICEICLAHPGTLPVPNREAVISTVKIARALNCTIATDSKFDRKHYFYPDLPKGYQISQYDQPIGEHGFIELTHLLKNHRPIAKIGITRVHLEEDTAKLTHAADGSTLVDFNRAGVPLVEIVSEPDIESGAEAKLYCQELQLIFQSLKVSGAEMEKGQMRCEVNISLQEEGTWKKENGAISPLNGKKLNAKVEVKNINSFKAVEKAIEYEIKRQSDLIAKGESWIPETRGWDENKNITTRQRSKESAADYRYFPEPDIPPFNPAELAHQISLPELPQAKRLRFHEEFGFSLADSHILSNDLHWANYTEEVVSELQEWLHCLPESKDLAPALLTTKKQAVAKLAGGWLTSKLTGLMTERSIDIRILRVKPENFAELIALIFTNRVNSTNALKILIEMIDSGVNLDPTHIMENKGYGQVNDESKITAVVEEIIKNYPKQVAEFKAGKEPIIKFLLGMAMKATEGSADPVVTEKLLREKLQ